MVAITSQVRRPYSKVLPSGAQVARSALVAAQTIAVFWLSQHKLWPLAVLAVLAVELWPLRPRGGVSVEGRQAYLLERALPVLGGVAASLIIAASLRLVAQLAVAVAYGVWRLAWSPAVDKGRYGMAHLLVAQAAAFEAVFLVAAMPTWHVPEVLVLSAVWASAYLPVYAVLSRRGERAAGVMAATWGVVAVEIAWVLGLWLFTYTSTGGYVLVPQPVLILTGLAYCFGSIYMSQRQGILSRGRLTEYLLIGLILIAIVIAGTPWKGSI